MVFNVAVRDEVLNDSHLIQPAVPQSQTSKSMIRRIIGKVEKGMRRIDVVLFEAV